MSDLGVRGASPSPRAMDSIETVVSEERSVQEPKTIANSNIAQQITTQLEKSKPKNSKDEKQKHVKWRGQLSAYEINPLLQVYKKNADEYAIKAREMANNTLRRTRYPPRKLVERPESSRSRCKRIQNGCVQSMGSLNNYTMEGYQEIHRTLDEIESVLNEGNPILIKDQTTLRHSQKIVSLPSLSRTPVTFERDGFGPILRYHPPRPGMSTTILRSSEETPVSSKQSLTAELRMFHESTAFHKDFEALIAIEAESQGTLNAIVSNHFQVLTDYQRISEEQAAEMIFNFIEHVKVQEEPLITRPVLQQLERVLDQVTTLTITQALYRIRSIVLSHIPKRKRVVLKAWMAHLCRLSQALGKDILPGLSVVLSDLQFRSIRITNGDDEWEEVLRFMKKENNQMEYMSTRKALQETVMDTHAPLNIQESVIEFLIRYSRAVL